MCMHTLAQNPNSSFSVSLFLLHHMPLFCLVFFYMFLNFCFSFYLFFVLNMIRLGVFFSFSFFLFFFLTMNIHMICPFIDT